MSITQVRDLEMKMNVTVVYPGIATGHMLSTGYVLNLNNPPKEYEREFVDPVVHKCIVRAAICLLPELDHEDFRLVGHEVDDRGKEIGYIIANVYKDQEWRKQKMFEEDKFIILEEHLWRELKLFDGEHHWIRCIDNDSGGEPDDDPSNDDAALYTINDFGYVPVIDRHAEECMEKRRIRGVMKDGRRFAWNVYQRPAQVIMPVSIQDGVQITT